MEEFGEYTAESIQVLEGVEPIRKRPGMYIGGTDEAAMHTLLWEVISNAIDEHLRGRGTTVCVTFDGSRVTVEDDGHGIPIDILEPVMTTLNHHGFHGPDYRRPHVHLDKSLHGIGVVVASALSSELEVVVRRDGRAYVQRYARGVALGPIAERGKTERSGTRISFVPDATIFERRRWNPDEIERRCREIAALIPSLTVVVGDRVMHYPGGMTDHLQHLAGDQQLIEPFHVAERRDGVGVEIAVAWVARGTGSLHTFINYAPAHDGTHVRGLFAGLNDVLGKRIDRELRPSRLRARIERRVIAIVHVSLDNPQFGNPTRDWLTTPEVGSAVRAVVALELGRHFERAPALLDSMLLDLQPRRRR